VLLETHANKLLITHCSTFQKTASTCYVWHLHTTGIPVYV